MGCYKNSLILFQNYFTEQLCRLSRKSRMHCMIKTIHSKNARCIRVQCQAKKKQNIQRSFTGIVSGKACFWSQISILELQNSSRRRNSSIYAWLFRCSHIKPTCPIDQFQDFIQWKILQVAFTVFILPHDFFNCLCKSASAQTDRINLIRIRERSSQCLCVRLINRIVLKLLNFRSNLSKFFIRFEHQ